MLRKAFQSVISACLPKAHTIIRLEEELVRRRQVLIEYLPPEWADGLQSDILNNISRDFKEEPAYDLYVSMVCNGIDPP